MKITIKEKREILAFLKHEVADFHPLLEELLKHLPRVIRVDYTHGSNEKGADFIISRNDDTLGDVDYIGTVVKTGKITTDLTKIEQQIEECELARHIVNGKKNIRLDEIWIITNESISKNAEEKIHHKYCSKKIKFIKNSDLIRLIDQHLPTYWGVNNLPVAKYLATCAAEVEIENASSSLTPLNGTRVKIKIELEPSAEKYSAKKKTKPQSLISLIEKHSFIIVEGDAGSGKSQLIRDTITTICDTAYYSEHKYIPVSVSYTNLFKNYDLDISKLFKSNHLHEALACQKTDNATIVVFVDGVDELLLQGRKIKDELTQIHTSFKKHPHVKVVISSRPLNLASYKKFLPDSVAYEVNRMTMAQVIQALKGACQSLSLSDRLWNDIRESDLFKQIPKNPISTLLLAQILSDNGHDLPSNLTDVYTRYIDIMLGSWDIEKGLQSRKEAEVASSILCNIADYFITHDLPCIGRNEALGFFGDYLSARNTGIEAKYLFEKVLSRSGILVEDRNGSISFKHRSFSEYFYALKKKNEFDDGFIDNRVYDALWRTIYFFYVGLHKDCESLLSKIVSISPKTTNERFWRFANVPNYFLAGYATPYDIVEKTMPALFAEMRDLYFDIVNKKVESSFSQMPEMFTLLFFQAASSSFYSYNFFIKSLESTALSVLEDKKATREEQAYTLYFVTSVFRSLKLPNPFDGLLEEFSRDIPPAIRFGILYNSDQIKEHSTLLKRNEKWIKHELKKNPTLKEYYKRIHNIPAGNPEAISMGKMKKKK